MKLKNKFVILCLGMLFYSVACSTNEIASNNKVNNNVTPTNNINISTNYEQTYEQIKDNKVNKIEKIRNNFGTVNIDKTYNSKGQDYRQKFIILHYTAVNREGSLKALTEREVSSHYLVTDVEGEPIYSLVDDDRRAWHAGSSSWKGRTNINDSSIGIEIVNLGNVRGEFEPYKEHQIKDVATLLTYLVNKYEVDPRGILAHSDIAPNRKSDPGPLFPWERLYKEYNLGIWYDEDIKIKYENMLMNNTLIYTILDAQNEFKNFGYGIETTGVMDKQTSNVIKAFQYRFRPSKYDGNLDNETYAILKALNDKYNK